MKEKWEREKSHYTHLLQNISKTKAEIRRGGGAYSCPQKMREPTQAPRGTRKRCPRKDLHLGEESQAAVIP